MSAPPLDEASVARAAPAANAGVELEDIQGLIRFGYKHLPEATFLLYRISDAAAARAWLAQAPVTSAADARPLPRNALQVALTREGLRALGAPDSVCDGLSLEFLAGMASDEARARRLGDLGRNAPGNWRWGAAEHLPHVAVLLYAAAGELAAWQAQIETQCTAGFSLVARLATSNQQGAEPFGFADGISQPQLDWHRTRPAADHDRLSYSNLSCLGEFLLGYPNEYGQYTPRPLLALEGAAARLPRAEDDPGRVDFGRNGSYLVIRQLRQDVDRFWHELDQRAGGDADLRERLAAAMVGRKKSGEPLVSSAPGASADRTDRAALNEFTFQSDPRGERCPIGAHIRRANPRNADFPAGSEGLLKRLIRMLGFDASVLHEDLIASTRFHRLLRRGRKYDGSPPNSGPTQADAPAHERGLHFMCLAANITRQFEFVQSAWLMGSGFAGLCGETDPLLDTRETGPDSFASDFFSLPQKDGPDRRLTGLPRFVTVVGGAYFFLPGVRALRYLAAAS